MTRAEPESAVDGTLEAIVAADRLALSEAGEESELLRQRCSVFYAYFALFGVLGAGVCCRAAKRITEERIIPCGVRR